MAYAPFGETYAESGSPDLSFTGQNPDTNANLYDFMYREYGIQGRWPSPDPAGPAAFDLANPQSLNRYAYVLNDPTDSVDPLGLLNIPTYQQLMEDSFTFDGLGGGMNCTADGVVTSCGADGALMEANGGVQCPNNNCGEGTPTPFQCAADVCGYMTTDYLNTHEYDQNGRLYSEAEFNELETNARDAQKESLADAICQAIDPTSADSCSAEVLNGLKYVTTTGGNANFTYQGRFLNAIVALFPGCGGGGEGPDCRITAFPSVHWHTSLNGLPVLHLDRGDLYFDFPFGLLSHIVDIFGMVNSSIPWNM